MWALPTFSMPATHTEGIGGNDLEEFTSSLASGCRAFEMTRLRRIQRRRLRLMLMIRYKEKLLQHLLNLGYLLLGKRQNISAKNLECRILLMMNIGMIKTDMISTFRESRSTTKSVAAAPALDARITRIWPEAPMP